LNESTCVGDGLVDGRMMLSCASNALKWCGVDGRFKAFVFVDWKVLARLMHASQNDDVSLSMDHHGERDSLDDGRLRQRC
jgi:hypothetical protein